MLKAVKENKIYSISELEIQDFLNRGFDVIKENGEVVKSPCTPVTVEDLEKLKSEYEEKLAKKDAEIKKLAKGATK